MIERGEKMEDFWGIDPVSYNGLDSTGLAAILGTYLLFMVVIGLVMIISLWKIFAKAGKPGWAVLVPIYNIIVLLEVVKKPVIWILLLLIPIVNFVVLIIIYVELAKVFGKGAGYAIGLIFLGVVFLPMLAFGDAKYVDA